MWEESGSAMLLGSILPEGQCVDVRQRNSKKLSGICPFASASVRAQFNNLLWVPEVAGDYPWETHTNVCDAGCGSKFWKGSAAFL